MLLLVHGFCISFPSQRGHVQRNLVYNPENAKEMVIRQCEEEPSSRKNIPTWLEKVRESEKKWAIRCSTI
jgi:hypothetical protein